MDGSNPVYKSIDGNLYNKEGTELIQYAIGRSVAEFAIPDSVIRIGGYAFYECSSLRNVTIPDSVTNIGDYAFYECSSLSSVTMGNGATSIGYGAFQRCGSLGSAIIPDSVTSIGGYVFSGCSSLSSITIGSGVTSIGNNAFGYCESLNSIEVDKNNTAYKSIDGNLYNKAGTELIQYAVGKQATEFVMPSGVTCTDGVLTKSKS